MNIKDFLPNPDEKPLDRLVSNGGMCSIFRTIACIGDSLSSGELQSVEFNTNTYHDYFDISWGQFLARDAGVTVHNFSRGGMTAREFILSYADLQNYYDLSKASQAYIIALGANDSNQIKSGLYGVGSIDSINKDNYVLNKPDYAGYYAGIISRFKEIQPHAKFFLITSPVLPDCEKDPEAKKLYDDMAQVVRDIAGYFSNCYVLDMRKYGPVYDEEFIRSFGLSGHMNSQGYRLFATMVESYIDYLVRNNPDDFKQACFVGTHHYHSGEPGTVKL